MGINQSIEKNIPNEFEAGLGNKSIPKVNHYHKTRLHNFHDDYYEKDGCSKSSHGIFESDIPQAPRSPNGSIYSSTNDQLEMEKPKEDSGPGKKRQANTLEVYDNIGRATSSFRDIEVLSMHSGGSQQNIKKLWIDKNACSDVKKTHFWELLPLNVAYKIVEYCIDDLSVMLKVHESWGVRIKNILYFKSSGVINKFKNRFNKQLTLLDHKAVLKKIKIQQSGRKRLEAHKLEIVLECRVEKALTNQTVSLSYRHKMDHKPKLDMYANYVFDVIGKEEKKVVWISQEQRKVEGVQPARRELGRLPV